MKLVICLPYTDDVHVVFPFKLLEEKCWLSMVYGIAVMFIIVGVSMQMMAVVTIGFVKDAKDHINIQGFNVYHKNRLIKVQLHGGLSDVWMHLTVSSFNLKDASSRFYFCVILKKSWHSPLKGATLSHMKVYCRDRLAFIEDTIRKSFV